MAHEKRFKPHKAAKLDDEARRLRQPVGKLVELISELLRPSSGSTPLIIDVGAGTGYFSLPLAGSIPTAKIVALDVAPKLLEKLMKRAGQEGLAQRIETLESEAEEAWQVAAGSAEVVLMSSIYHEFDNRKAVLEQARRALAEGGWLIITDWDPEAPGTWGPPREHRISAENAQVELKAAGFEKADRHDIYSDFYTLVAQACRTSPVSLLAPRKD
jgi:SAM-dependent methyltransferase